MLLTDPMRIVPCENFRDLSGSGNVASDRLPAEVSRVAAVELLGKSINHHSFCLSHHLFPAARPKRRDTALLSSLVRSSMPQSNDALLLILMRPEPGASPGTMPPSKVTPRMTFEHIVANLGTKIILLSLVLADGYGCLFVHDRSANRISEGRQKPMFLHCLVSFTANS
jgi:hypothetical protein